MALEQRELKTDAAANTLLAPNANISSKHDVNVTLGVTSPAATLAVGYPIGFNSTTGDHGPWTAPDATVAVITLTGATGGTFTITVNNATTGALAWNATAAVVAAALKAIGFDVTVALGTLIYTLTFDGQAEIEVVPTVTADLSLITGDVTETVVVTPGTAASDPLTPTSITFDTGTRSAGTWTITHGAQTTAAIAFAATPAAVEAALAALTTPSIIANCTKTTPTTWQIDFDSLVDLVTLPTVSITDSLSGGADDAVSLATAGTALVPDATTIAIDVGTATGGSFTITVNGLTTAAIAFNATANAVDAAILLATGVVSTTILASTTYTSTFGSLPELVVLPIIEGSVSGVTGGVIGIVITAGTSTFGTDEVKLFINPEIVTTSAAAEVMAVCMDNGTIDYALPASLVDSGDVAALAVAMKNNLIEKGLIVQGLPGRY